ncbi:DUF167 domain-containing protein [Candidatus Binatia bacterium]|jgi:uncharacterized protein (TIGR00251 family)|nr:DUF167 domain-containing protein [Candidatus Binatia bacterium]
MDPDDLVLTPGEDGIRLRLRVAPGARRDGVVGVHGGALKLAVRAVAEKGRANDAVLRLLAGVLGVALQDVELVAGGGSRDKVVVLRRIDAAGVRARLREALAPRAATR